MINYHIILLLCLAFVTNILCMPKEDNSNQEELENKEYYLTNFMQNIYEEATLIVINKQTLALWDLDNDINNDTKAEAILNQTLITAQYNKNIWKTYIKGLKPDQFKNPTLKRQILLLSILGTDALDDDKLSALTNIQSKMTNIYSTAKICPYQNQNCDIGSEGLSLEPDLVDLMSSVTDYDELEYLWSSWRNATGAKMRQDYKTYVDLSNEAAKKNGFSDMGELWRAYYESENFIQDLDRLWKEVKPLYDELHTYVSYKLRERYPQLAEHKDNLIPAHLLGNMWAQTWIYIYDLVKPFSNASAPDATNDLIAQGYTPLRMFEIADEFFKSLGLESNHMCYNVSAGAVIEKPKDREIVCHASAWDFYDKEDYRIKMCTRINQEDLVTIHHEMGHIQYYILYKDQPVTFRTGANPGFHEAVGDTIALSVANPKHLQKIGLLKDYVDSEEASLNALMYMALEKVAFLPFGLLIDKWRWDAFSGAVNESEWNKRWWYYRENIQKIKAPNTRTEDYFDPGAKFHVPDNSQYIAYFVAHLLEFQLHKALCIAAKEYDPNSPEAKPLHKCDIYQSKEAGAKLRAGLSLGASRHWSEVLEAMTGEKMQSGQSLIEYFQPLFEYLKKENAKLFAKENVDTNEVSSDYTKEIIIVVGFAVIVIIICIVLYLLLKKLQRLI